MSTDRVTSKRWSPQHLGMTTTLPDSFSKESAMLAALNILYGHHTLSAHTRPMQSLQVDSWQTLQGFLQSFAASQPGTIARSALHYGLTRPRSLGGPWGSTWALDADGMAQAVGLPQTVLSQLPEEVGLFLEQALVLVSLGFA